MPSSERLRPVPDTYAYFQTPMWVQVQTTMAVPDACARFQTPVTTRHRQSAKQSSDRLNVSLCEWCRYSSWCKCAKTHLGNRSILPFSRTRLLDTMSDHCPTSLCDPVATARYSLPETKRSAGQCAQKGLFTRVYLYALGGTIVEPSLVGRNLWKKTKVRNKMEVFSTFWSWRHHLGNTHCSLKESCERKLQLEIKLWCTMLRN